MENGIPPRDFSRENAVYERHRETLERAHKKDWAGALKAYQAHLKVRGSTYVATADEKATLDYLTRMARAK